MSLASRVAASGGAAPWVLPGLTLESRAWLIERAKAHRLVPLEYWARMQRADVAARAEAEALRDLAS